MLTLISKYRTDVLLPRTNPARRATTSRRGFSMVEVQVAFVLFGIALAGLCPCLVMYTKQLRNVQQRLNPQTTYYLLPATDPWARKLGAAATLSTLDTTVLPSQGNPPPQPNQVLVNSVDHSLLTEDVTAYVTVQAAQQ